MMAPNGRGLRDKMIEATAELISESGVGSVTHRTVAQRAETSLGSTTYHFATLDDLIVAALDRSADRYQSYLNGWLEQHRNDTTDQLLAAIARSVYDHSTGKNRGQAVAAQELYTAAVRRPALIDAAMRSFMTTKALLEQLFGANASRILSPLLAGITTELILDPSSFAPEAVEQVLVSAVHNDS